MEIDGETKICALIGDPVGHSLSPKIHNAAFQHLKLNYAYIAFQVTQRELPKALLGIRALKIRGLNVTMPLKTRIIPYLDELDPNAAHIKAVNTVLNKKGKLVGYNTDGLGALDTLKANNQDPGNKKVVILGAGGAARAISYNLARVAEEVVVLNRTREKAVSLVRNLNKIAKRPSRYGSLTEEQLKKELQDTDILINATSIGMYPHQNETAVNRKLLHPNLVVFDIVYNPVETKLLKAAKETNAQTINGVTMLIQQAVLAFKIWTGKKAPIDIMFKTCYENLEK